MPKVWHAVPHTKNPKLHIKSPTYAAFVELDHHYAQYGLTILPKAVSLEEPIAEAILSAIPDMRDLALGATFTLQRYPQGLSVTGPSGWTFMMPFDTKTGEVVEGASSANPKGIRRPKGKAAKTA